MEDVAPERDAAEQERRVTAEPELDPRTDPEASDADVVEQALPVAGPEAPRTMSADLEAPDADVYEQAQVEGFDEDDDRR